jgi:GT2 family glycosyltransferase
MYTEDLELMLKLNKINARMYYTPSTSIIHLDGKSADALWTSAEKEELMLRQALEVYGEQSGKTIFKIHKFLWMALEYMKYKRSGNMKSYYRYSFLAKNSSSKR